LDIYVKSSLNRLSVLLEGMSLGLWNFFQYIPNTRGRSYTV